MSNHWQLVVWPREAGELSWFTGWFTRTHTQRWHAHRHTTGSGHVYQGRFKSFPVQKEERFYTVCRYVERNAVRANLAARAEDCRGGSLHRWKSRAAKEKSVWAAWPWPRLPGWVDHVNEPQTESELAALRGNVQRGSVQRGNPFGEASWSDAMVFRLGLESTLRPPGRPKKRRNGS